LALPFGPGFAAAFSALFGGPLCLYFFAVGSFSQGVDRRHIPCRFHSRLPLTNRSVFMLDIIAGNNDAVGWLYLQRALGAME